MAPLWLPAYAAGCGVVGGLLGGLWGVSVAIRDASIIDIFWGPGFVALAGTTQLLGPKKTFDARSILVLSLLGLWAARLSAHIGYRNKGQPEDKRYQAMRKFWGRWFPVVSIFTVFLLQGAILATVAAPVVMVTLTRKAVGTLGVWDALATACVVTGTAMETIADFQLQRFIENPANRGRVMDRGLWRYSRHPNYFGDAVVWWGFYLFGVAVGYPLTFFSPVIMTILLRYVSGVTLLEKDIGKRRAGYEEYVRRTNAFIPWFPKK